MTNRYLVEAIKTSMDVFTTMILLAWSSLTVGTRVLIPIG